MASATLNVASVFPDATSIGAYLARGQTPSAVRPLGSAVNTQTVSGGSVTFTGLTEDESYVAMGSVNGTYKSVTFKVDDAPTEQVLSDADNVFTGSNSFLGSSDGETFADAGPLISLVAEVDMPTASPDLWFGMLDLTMHNTHTTPADGSIMAGINIRTEADAIDTAAGMRIENEGRADGLYIRNAGKAGAVSNNSPSGIGMDMNHSYEGGENSETFTGVGMQIWDHSETDQGVEGPRGILLRKHLNADTQHRLLHLQGNRYLVEIDIEDASPTLDVVFRVINDADQLMGINNDGSIVLAEDTPILFGASAYVEEDGDWLDISGGTSGTRFKLESDGSNVVTISSTGVLTAAAGLNVPAFHVATQIFLQGATDGNGYIEFVEQSVDPAAPAANKIRLYAKDNGSGKTGLYARANTGAVQLVALEP